MMKTVRRAGKGVKTRGNAESSVSHTHVAQDGWHSRKWLEATPTYRRADKRCQPSSSHLTMCRAGNRAKGREHGTVHEATLSYLGLSLTFNAISKGDNEIARLHREYMYIVVLPCNIGAPCEALKRSWWLRYRAVQQKQTPREQMRMCDSLQRRVSLYYYYARC